MANSRGTFARDDRTRVVLGLTVVAQREGVIQTGRETLAHLGGYELIQEADIPAFAEDVADKALIMLGAIPSPSGRMPVVLAGGFGGVLFHEAVGHGLEADFIVKRTSIWEGRLGERVAADFVTAYDDGVTRRHVGQRPRRRRGHPHGEDPGGGRRRPQRLPGRPAAWGQTGDGLDRERPAAELPPPALSAHDQHLLRAGHRLGRST